VRGDYVASVPPAVAKHLYAMAEDVPETVLSDNAFVALLLISTATVPDFRPRIIADAYQKFGRWWIECHGVRGKDSRFSIAGWELMCRRYLAHDTILGNMPMADCWMAACQKIADERPTDCLYLDEQWGEVAPEGEVPA
jgi:hypothetical protein